MEEILLVVRKELPNAVLVGPSFPWAAYWTLGAY